MPESSARRILSVGLRWAGICLLIVAVLIIVGGDIVYVMKATRKWQALWEHLTRPPKQRAAYAAPWICTERSTS